MAKKKLPATNSGSVIGWAQSSAANVKLLKDLAAWDVHDPATKRKMLATSRRHEQQLNRVRGTLAKVPGWESLDGKADRELAAIQKKRKKPKKGTKVWMQEIHRLRIQSLKPLKLLKWLTVYNRLKDREGFPYSSQSNMEQGYGRKKKEHPEWFV